MTGGSKPNDIARETLRLLISHGEAATPENYRRRYREIAGGSGDESGHAAECMLRELAAALPRTTPELARTGAALASATAHRHWDKALTVLLGLAQSHDAGVANADWAHVLRELVRLLRENQFGLSTAEKRAALDKALAGGGDMRALYARLATLAAAWTHVPITVTVAAADFATFAADAAGKRHATQGDHAAQPTTSELRELLAHTLEVSIATRLIDVPELAADATVLAQRLRAAAPMCGTELRGQLRALWTEIEAGAGRRDQIQDGLMRLLRLLVENVGELVADDHWLRGQIAMVLQVIARPLDLAAIEEALANLQNVIRRQSLVKQSLNATKATLKEMVASFIDELGRLSAATGDYHDSIENLAQQIRQTEDVGELNVLLEEVLRETRNVQASALHSRQEVLRARENVDAAEAKIRELERELESISEKVRQDHLTGTLNRRGLNEAFDRELAVAERQAQALSIALLDIDNFKEFNDQLGHQAGDDALVHLARVIKETMRPSDTIARYGGEEFMILLPDTDTELAVSVIGRLQRELTKRFFLHDNRKLLITFSAGVACHLPGEKQADVIARADRALYQAKLAGKNRVLAEAAAATALPGPLRGRAPGTAAGGTA